MIGGFVAQLVRALPCHGRGREFESRRIRHRKSLSLGSGVFYVKGDDGARTRARTWSSSAGVVIVEKGTSLLLGIMKCAKGFFLRENLILPI